MKSDPRRQSRCYVAHAARARAVVLEDYASSAPDPAVPAFDDTCDIAPCTVMFASGGSVDHDFTPPVSVTAARLHPHYGGAHGWKASMTKEVRRVEGI